MDKTQRGRQKRGRGRPREVVNEQDAALKVRRERNREAQQLFRDRRQAAMKEEQLYMESLEQNMDRLNAVFLGLVDGLLARNTVQQDSEAMQLLRSAVDKFASVASSHESASAQSTECGKDADEEALPPGIDLMSDPGRESSSSSDLPPWRTPPPGGDVAGEHSYGSAPGVGAPPNLAPEVAQAMMAPGAGLANVFGNGWADPPNLFTRSLQVPYKTHTPDSLAIRLIQFSFAMIHDSLLYDYGNPHSLCGTVLAFALARHTREEMLYTSRWYLGPGLPNISRLAGVSGRDKTIDDPNTSHFPHVLDSQIDTDALSAVTGCSPPPGSSVDHCFMNATQIEDYLMQQNVKYIHPDILEIASAHAPTVRAQASFLNSDVFFPGERSTPAPEPAGPGAPSMPGDGITRISLTLLYTRLTQVSRCLSNGPGFPIELVDWAITGSIV
ncbi:hypothetical protein GQ53DRAFT_761365 [Thozetella sp. PMI_491]|nr:hypothetical protein GQ53DRAFT_761365 [Thozetella sp. PMI_491]